MARPVRHAATRCEVKVAVDGGEVDVPFEAAALVAAVRRREALGRALALVWSTHPRKVLS